MHNYGNTFSTVIGYIQWPITAILLAVLSCESEAHLSQNRVDRHDWCTCGNCWPVMHAESSNDVKCCQERLVRLIVNINNSLEMAKSITVSMDIPLFLNFCPYAMHLKHFACTRWEDADM